MKRPKPNPAPQPMRYPKPGEPYDPQRHKLPPIPGLAHKRPRRRR